MSELYIGFADIEQARSFLTINLGFEYVPGAVAGEAIYGDIRVDVDGSGLWSEMEVLGRTAAPLPSPASLYDDAGFEYLDGPDKPARPNRSLEIMLEQRGQSADVLVGWPGGSIHDWVKIAKGLWAPVVRP